MSEYNAQAQDRTLAFADAWGEPWSPNEVEFVQAFTDDATDEEIAVTLGRSLYAIWSIQSRLRTGDLDFDRATRVTTSARVAQAPTYTFIGDDVPPGW